MFKKIIFLFLVLVSFSCSKKSDIPKPLPENVVKTSEEVKMEEKGLPPIVSQKDIIDLCHLNSLCKYNKLSKSWEIKGYEMIELTQYHVNTGHSFFFKKIGYDYDFKTKKLTTKKEITTDFYIKEAKGGKITKTETKVKVICEFDYSKPDSCRLIGS